MKKVLTVLMVLMATIVYSQTALLEGVELIDTNTVFGVTQARIVGIDQTSSPKRLLYQFVHPNGAIQQVRGSLMSGGKNAANLPAFGAVTLGETLDAATHKLQWYCPDRVGSSVNFMVQPLLAATDHMSGNVLAKKGDIMGHDAFEQLLKTLTPSSPLYQFPDEEDQVEAAPTYVDSYLKTLVNIGMSGKISSLTTSSFALKPEGERNKGLFGTAYKGTHDSNKEHTKTAFGEDETISYKLMSGIPQAYDPVTGHAAVFGGIKYKKNKAKENSHFYEFMLLTFNNNGEVVNRVNYESEEPLRLEEVYPIYGDNLAPGVEEATHAIFLARGGGNKNTPNINGKRCRIFVVDIVTGEIVKQDEVEFVSGATKLIQTRQLDGNRIALTYHYTSTNGIVVMTIGLDGIESMKEIKGDSPEFKAIGLADGQHAGLSLERLSTFDAADGGTVTIERFITKQGTSSTGYTIANHGFTFMHYDANGNLLGVQGIGNLINKHNRDFISVEDGKICMMAYLKGANGASRLKIITMNTNDFTVQSAMIPDGEYLVSSGAYYYDDASASLYFLTQKRKGRGISIFKYKL